MNLGENIYNYRKKSGMSQGDLAHALDVSRQSVSKWETGAAVPELDKLVKMSELFGITLDELVGSRTTPAEPTQSSSDSTEPAKIIGEPPAPVDISKQAVIGTILLICALIGSQILSSQGWFDAPEILLLMIPLLLCGILCITTKHPDFYCGWIAVVGYWIWFFLLVPQWEEHAFLIFYGTILVFLMVLRSVHIHKQGILHIPVWLWIIGGIILIAAGILLLVNTVPPFWISSFSAPAASANIPSLY